MFASPTTASLERTSPRRLVDAVDCRRDGRGSRPGRRAALDTANLWLDPGRDLDRRMIEFFWST
jgi:hypothetical protein